MAVWKRTLPEAIPEKRMKRLLGKLCSLPQFYLPPATVFHTRHFMPWEGPGGRTMVFDTFVVLSPSSELVVDWPEVELEEQERTDLKSILERLPYLGRSESWCKARLLGAPFLRANCLVLAPGEESGLRQEAVRVLAPSEPLDYDALLVETSELRAKRMDPANPPGSRWVLYGRPYDCFLPKAQRREPSRKGNEDVPTVVRYAIDSKVPPLTTDALKVGDLARRAAMAIFGRKYGGGVSLTLSGKDSSGRPLKGHKHAFYLPTDEDEDGWVDHLTVWTPAGLDEKELNALADLDVLNTDGGRPPIHLALLGIGNRKDFSCNLFARSRVWRSITPFVLVRHPKWRGDTQGGKVPKRLVDGPEDQVELELQRRSIPQPTTVESLERSSLRGRSTHWLDFYRWRRKGRTSGRAYGFRIEFPEPVRGPIALGFAAHFGLGLFMPEEVE